MASKCVARDLPGKFTEIAFRTIFSVKILRNRKKFTKFLKLLPQRVSRNVSLLEIPKNSPHFVFAKYLRRTFVACLSPRKATTDGLIHLYNIAPPSALRGLNGHHFTCEKVVNGVAFLY